MDYDDECTITIINITIMTITIMTITIITTIITIIAIFYHLFNLNFRGGAPITGILK